MEPEKNRALRTIRTAGNPRHNLHAVFRQNSLHPHSEALLQPYRRPGFLPPFLICIRSGKVPRKVVIGQVESGEDRPCQGGSTLRVQLIVATPAIGKCMMSGVLEQIGCFGALWDGEDR